MADIKLIAQILGATPNLTARQIVRILADSFGIHSSRTAVNSLLYSQRSVFCRDESDVPKWTLIPQQVRQMISSRELGLYSWQLEALEAWERNGYQGVVEAVTGAGKTRVGISAAASTLDTAGKVLVLVPTVELMYQWRAHIESAIPDAQIGILGDGEGSNFATSDIIIAVVNSARNHDLNPGRADSLLIADECHRYGSQSNQEALNERFARRLGLTATYQRNDSGNSEWLDPF